MTKVRSLSRASLLYMELKKSHQHSTITNLENFQKRAANPDGGPASKKSSLSQSFKISWILHKLNPILHNHRENENKGQWFRGEEAVEKNKSSAGVFVIK